MRTRSKVAASIAALAAIAATAVWSGSTSATAAGPGLLPLSVTNNTGRSEAVYLYVLGTDTKTGKLGYVNGRGAFTPWPGGANPPALAPDVAIPGPGNGASTTIQVPNGISGRVYFSFGQRMKFAITADGGLVQPAPWAGGDPNRDILFDWSEFTYDEGGLWLNSSQVDMFAVPHTVSVTAGAGAVKSTGTLVPNGRDNVINGLKAQPGWGGSVQARADGTVLRVLAPGKAAETGKLSGTYLDSYITSAWNAYTGKTLTVVPFGDQPNTKFFGRTSGNAMRFTNGAGQQVASFTKPSTANVWGCDGALAAPNDQVVGPIARTLCAALNRGTLGTIDTQPGGKAVDFYKSDPTNQYAKLIHANMADGKAYAFAFDDVGNAESLVHDGSPRSAGITLNSFGGGGAPPPPPPAQKPPTEKPPAEKPPAEKPPAEKPPAEKPPASGGSKIVSVMHGKCVDVPAQNFSDGIPLQVYGCNNTAAQQWDFTNGTVKTRNNLCMDVAWGSSENGAAIQIATCSGNPAQQFVLSEAGDLVNPQANKCVDVQDKSRADRARLILWECSGNSNQKWRKG